MKKENDYNYQKLNGDVSKSEEMELKDNDLSSYSKKEPQELEPFSKDTSHKGKTIDVVQSMQ